MTRRWYQLASHRLTLVLIAAVLYGAAASPERASAAVYSGPRVLSPFIWYSVYLSAGTTYTIETRNNTSGADPVMHLISQSSLTQVAADDDAGGNLNSKITYTPTQTNFYYVWVHSYNSTSSGNADLYLNNALQLPQAPFGGILTTLPWSSGQRFYVSGTQRGAPNDTMLFLLRNSTQYLQHDDDSGANAYSMLTSNSNESGSSRAVWGLYPGSNGAAALLKDDCSTNCVDTDGDGVSDALETASGTSTTVLDTDADGIIDRLELFGNDGYSFSEGDAIINQATHRNIYIELDYMSGTGLGQNKKPYANLAADIATIFATDGNTRVDILVDTALPWHKVISFNSCPAGSDCVLYSDVKSANFAPTDIYKKFLFRYAVFANNVSAANNCAPGAAELNGNDLIVSLDTTPFGCGKTFSQAEQRGVFMHMLGHNIGFNIGPVSENPVNNSTVYQSVMNYRYMISGIPGRTGVLAHSYSFGANGCDACLTSPEQQCISTRLVNACNHNPNCDCDVAEWPSIYVNPVTTDPLPWVN